MTALTVPRLAGRIGGVVIGVSDGEPSIRREYSVRCCGISRIDVLSYTARRVLVKWKPYLLQCRAEHADDVGRLQQCVMTCGGMCRRVKVVTLACSFF